MSEQQATSPFSFDREPLEQSTGQPASALLTGDDRGKVPTGEEEPHHRVDRQPRIEPLEDLAQPRDSADPGDQTARRPPPLLGVATHRRISTVTPRVSGRFGAASYIRTNRSASSVAVVRSASTQRGGIGW